MTTTKVPSIAQIHATIKHKVCEDPDLPRIEYEYKAENGRLFMIEREENSYFLCEYKPNGRVFYPATENTPERFLDDAYISEASDSPNELFERCRAIGLDPAYQVIRGAGSGDATSLYYDSLWACAEKIHEAIRDNVWYDCVDREKLNDPVRNARLKREHEKAMAEAHQRDIELYKRSLRQEQGVFKGLYMPGQLLPADQKFAIQDYLESPSEQKWDQISRLHVQGVVTLWEAWVRYDTKAPPTKPIDGPWPKIPSAKTLKQCLRWLGGDMPEPIASMSD